MGRPAPDEAQHPSLVALLAPAQTPGVSASTTAQADATATSPDAGTAAPTSGVTAMPTSALAEAVAGDTDETVTETAWPVDLTEDDYLPIYRKASTDEKVIAVTIDDMYQFQNAVDIVDLALANGAKLTLFPVGKNAMRDGLSGTLRFAYENGFEIENHTYDHVGLYKLNDQKMAKEVYYQALSVDYALGVSYQQHFFRPYGGDGLDDQRTHLYARQLGMLGIASWSVSGSDTPADKLEDTLAPGNVYLFHTTDSDTKKLRSFIPAAVAAGYRLVTLNELFGLPDNEVTALTKPITDYEIPPVDSYQLAPRVYKKGNFLWGVNLIQQRLHELGYLKGKPDGIYGETTVSAVKSFQTKNGLKSNGKCNLSTQQMLFSQDAKSK